MKKRTLLILAVLLAGILSACSSGKKTEAPEPEKEQVTEAVQETEAAVKAEELEEENEAIPPLGEDEGDPDDVEEAIPPLGEDEGDPDETLEVFPGPGEDEGDPDGDA